MGIEGLSFGKDYAAEFNSRTEKAQAYLQGRLDALKSTTIPIGGGAVKENTDELPKGYRIEVTKPQERTLDNKDNFNAQVERTKAEIEKAGKRFETGNVTVYTDKKEFKAAKKQYKQDVDARTKKYIEQGYDKKTAKQKAREEIAEPRHRSSNDLAKDIVKNDRNRQRFETTNVYIDKDAYNQAQKANEAKRDELAAQYQQEGLSEKEAKKKAELNVPLNTYVKDNDTKKYVAAEREYFYNENGEFQSDKFKERALQFANRHTGENEETNYHLSLKERRQVTAEHNANPDKKVQIKNDVPADMAHRSNLGWEEDHTRVIRGAVIGGGALVGAGAGAILSPAATATAVAAGSANAGAIAGAASSTAGAVAGAGASASAAATATAAASVDMTLAGAGIGGALGAASAPFLADKGGTEPVIPKLHQEQPTQPVQPTPVQPTPVQPVEPTPVQPVQPAPVNPSEPAPVCELTPDEILEETCKYNLKKGQSLYDAVRDGYQLKDHKEIMKYVHAIKDRYGIDYKENTKRTEWEMPELYGRKFNCDAKVKGTVKRYANRQSDKVGAFERRDAFWYEDCEGNKSEIYHDRNTRDTEMKKRDALLNTPAA